MDLIELENNFGLGNYQYVINEASNPELISSLSSQDKLKVKVLLYRAYLTQHKYTFVMEQIQPTDPDSLIAIQLLAMFLASPDRQSEIMVQVNAVAKHAEKEPVLSVVLATIFYLYGDFQKALELVSVFERNLECVMFSVQLLLQINRPDIARTKVMNLKGINLDSVLTNLSESWIGIQTGEPGKYEEGFYLYEELITGNLKTSKLLCAKGVCLLHAGRFGDAQKCFEESLEIDANHEESLMNMVVCLSYLLDDQKEHEFLSYFFLM
jgi:tetratricopeptide (TPR) repeat protein